MAEEDVETNRKIGAHGLNCSKTAIWCSPTAMPARLLQSLMCTALGVIRAARESGKRLSVIATETRPVMQGSRLTAFELLHDGIDVSLITDTAVGHMMAMGVINHVIVGADRVLHTGHVFNKIGTYQVAILANKHNVPFYVAAPLSTFDFESNPDDVIIEDRSADEVVKVGKKRIAPKGVRVFNPAFDMTPPSLSQASLPRKAYSSRPLRRILKHCLADKVFIMFCPTL